jgi:hypothetical protein
VERMRAHFIPAVDVGAVVTVVTVVSVIYCAVLSLDMLL